MNVLVAFERFGRVRDALIARGHNAWSVDLKAADHPQHHQGDALPLILGDCVRLPTGEPADLLLAFYPCTFLCSSGLHRNKGNPARTLATLGAIEDVRQILAAKVKRLALENPIGCISTAIRKPDQIIQPHQFGEDASKATCLWLNGLLPLRPTEHIAPRWVNGRPRWANQTDGGQNRLGPSETRADERGKTYAGIAAAFAEQWG